jgi:TolA-binding protein
VSEVNAQYTLGYCYLKLEDYNRAGGYFNSVMKVLSSSIDAGDKKLHADAALRDGDCEFVSKNYGSAVSSYDVIISKKLPGSDYALYQKAIIQGLQNKNTDKLTTLKRITSEYPSSIYVDDALYEIGVSYLTVPSYQDAASVFNQIISRYPNSSYVRKAHLKMGLIHFNLDNDQKALDEYKWVLSKYPKSPEGAEALNGVKEIYTAKGDAQGYLDFVKGVPNANITDAVKDSVMYLAAETKYSKNDCSGAVKEFSNYLKSFPGGSFALHAHFYRAECLFKQKEFESSLADYAFVADQPQNRFTEKSLLNAARISYVQKKDYDNAYKYYRSLSENAEFKADNLEALKGMMYSSYYLNHYDDAASAAQQILSMDNAKSDDHTEAHYYLAKIFYSQNNLTKAFSEFASVAKEKSNIGAEASYTMAEIYFKQSNLKAAEEQSYSLIRQKPSYDYWIAKSYLLIASIFEEEGDYFQSKSTLQSIIDNYKGADEIVAAAKQKLQSVTAKESNQSKLKTDNLNNEMELDSVPPNN